MGTGPAPPTRQWKVTCNACPAGQTCVDNGSCCTPTTCTSLGHTCGTWPDGCGGLLQCGSCSGFCDSTGQCQPCTSDSQCGPPNLCEDIRCTQYTCNGGACQSSNLPLWSGCTVGLFFDPQFGCGQTEYGTCDGMGGCVVHTGLPPECLNGFCPLATAQCCCTNPNAGGVVDSICLDPSMCTAPASCR
jgi:hypothetical protein